MEYTDDFKALQSQENFPHYKVYPVTKEPDIQEVNGQRGFSWVVALEPALDIPEPLYFLRAGRQNGVAVQNLISIRGDLALFFRLATQGTEQAHKEAMLTTIGEMAILANVWENTQDTADVLAQKKGLQQPDMW